MPRLIRTLINDCPGNQRKVWILVIHYGFLNDETPANRREGNEQDLKNLRKTFSFYEDCIYAEVASPHHTDVPKILKDPKLANNKFAEEITPPVAFFLFILSHGDENGQILTDLKTSDHDHFTTFDVWDALKRNTFLETSLKINVFAPCRGTKVEAKMPQKHVDVGRNSTSIIGPPNKADFINIYSTVESTISNLSLREGSLLVNTFCKELQSLEVDVDVVEFLRRVQNHIINNSDYLSAQTPQISVYPHAATQICSRATDFEPVNKNRRLENARDYFEWFKSNLVFKRGPALIFSAKQNKLEASMKSALRELEFCPLLVDVSKAEHTLKNISVNGLMHNEGCLMVVFFASIYGGEDKCNSGLTVDLGDSIVPIGELTRKFISSQCPTFAEKPKIFTFLDVECKEDAIGSRPSGVLNMDQVDGNNHSGFLVFVGFGMSVARDLIQRLGDENLRNGSKWLQQTFLDVLGASQSQPSQRVSQLWSTMPLKVDFPRCKDFYVPHNFFKRGSGRVGFKRFVNILKNLEHQVVLLHAPPGMGKSRASEEIHTSLVLADSNLFVLHFKLIKKISYWTTYDGTKPDKKPSVKSFLASCVAESKFNEMIDRLDKGRLFIIMDGFDEICPILRKKVLRMTKDLLDKQARLLITSRPQEKDAIITDLSQVASVAEYSIEVFYEEKEIQMLKTRLNIEEDKCREILKNFNAMYFGFTHNPLHLQLICEIEEIEHKQQLDIYSIYQDFFSKKVVHGLLTSTGMNPESLDFVGRKSRMFNVLTRCGALMVLDNKEVHPELTREEVLCINLSGVATVIDSRKPVDFVHRTFAEYLTARFFLKNFFQQSAGEESDDEDDEEEEPLDANVDKLFSTEVSAQTLVFFEAALQQFSHKLILPSVKVKLAEVMEQVFSSICRAGMMNLFTNLNNEHLLDKEQVSEWLSQAFPNRKLGLFFLACGSNLKLAELLAPWCPELHLEDVDDFSDEFARHSQSSAALSMALSKVADWQSRWPSENFFTKHTDISSNFSTEQYEFALENSRHIDGQGLLQLFYSFNESSRKKSILPLLIKLGVDLTHEDTQGRRLFGLFFSQGGEIMMLEHAVAVAKHFQSTSDYDSVESRHWRKTIGARCPEDLELDCSSPEGRRMYFQHIVDCAAGLFDPGSCEFQFSSIAGSEERDYELRRCREDPDLIKIAVNYQLFALRTCVADDENDAVEIFKQEQENIDVSFKYRCGCTPVHDAAKKGNLPLLLELEKWGFSLSPKNNKGETPLHWSSRWRKICTEHLLKRFLGSLYVPLGTKGPDSKVRSEAEQNFVEEVLCQRDNADQTLLLASTESTIDDENGELLVQNLLGHLYISPADDEAPARAQDAQQRVERLLLVANNKGKTPLHGAASGNDKLPILQVLLKNLLADDYISGQGCAVRPRSLNQQQRIADLLLKKTEKGFTPLHSSVKKHYSYKTCELLLRNVLGVYFVEEDGTTLKAHEERTEEENQFVQEVLLHQDLKGRTAVSLASNKDHSRELFAMNTVPL